MESRIVVEENDGFLFYSNRGEFIAKSVESVLNERRAALSVACKAEQVGHYTKETGLNKTATVKLILQIAENAGPKGFKRAIAFDIYDRINFTSRAIPPLSTVSRSSGRMKT